MSFVEPNRHSQKGRTERIHGAGCAKMDCLEQRVLLAGELVEFVQNGRGKSLELFPQQLSLLRKEAGGSTRACFLQVYPRLCEHEGLSCVRA